MASTRILKPGTLIPSAASGMKAADSCLGMEFLKDGEPTKPAIESGHFWFDAPLIKVEGVRT